MIVLLQVDSACRSKRTGSPRRLEPTIPADPLPERKIMAFTYPKSAPATLRGAQNLLMMAPLSAFESGWHRAVLPGGLAARVDAMIDDVDEVGNTGRTIVSVGGEGPRTVRLAILPATVSRYNSPTRAEHTFGAARGAGLAGKKSAVIVAVDQPDHAGGVLASVARACPAYSAKSKKAKPTRVAFLATDAAGKTVSLSRRDRVVADDVRWAAEMVDIPAEDMGPAAFVRAARRLVKGVPSVKVQVITGDALKKAGLGGTYAVGRAATVAPRMLILDYKPARAKRTVALVGKGVVYDSGGLNLKSAWLESMKMDMGGAAATVAAFHALATTGCRHRIVALAPLAENAIDARSYRPGDVITMHSGHTVEINNTDAEGRLLLGDAVSYAARKIKPDAIIDSATLTGAQLVATGERHAAVMSNRDGLERAAVESGKQTGDVVCPLIFAPEIFQAEFESRVADMRNSVKSRMNGQTSAAGQFIYNHIDDLDVPWLHIDLAGPAWRYDRGTGFGVALLTAIAARIHEVDLDA